MHTVATGHSLRQLSVNISQRDRESVVLHFTAHLEILTGEALLHALVPVGHILLVVGVGQREHGVLMFYLPELCVQVAAHALGG